jgi:hypothetical protein
MVLLADQVRERSATVAELAEQSEESFLVLAGGFAPCDRMPRDQQCIGISELPDIPAAPMPDRLPCTETRELLQPLGGNVGLPDVHDMRAGHPLSFESRNVDSRVPPLEMTTRVDIEELGVGRGVSVDDVHPGTAGYLYKAVGAQLVPCAPADNPAASRSGRRKDVGSGGSAGMPRT